MPVFLDSKDKNKFFSELEKISEVSISGDEKVEVAAREIISKVIKNGDKALDEFTKKFDNPNHKAGNFLVSKKEIDAAVKSCSAETISALKHSIERVKNYHQKQKPESVDYKDAEGIRLGWLWNPLDSVGLYVPGGTASYPSSVIMNAIPAIVAGVKRIVIVTPANGGKINPVVLAAAKLCGISEIYRIGGAQAIAALSYGTKSIKPVDKIVGPGNAYVAAAKRGVFGTVGVDMIAGPSEILIIADKDNNPDWLASDLLSQAEHDASARTFFVSDSADLIEKVISSVGKILPTLPRKKIAGESIARNSYFLKVANIEEAVKVANILAPEHLELSVKSPDKYISKLTNCGAIFIGEYTPEAIGDYIAGPSHVLPTSASARFSSGLSVYDFIKKTSLIGCNKKSFLKLAGDAEILAAEEGLHAHALSLKLRKDD